jgi:hypothetical protein
MTAIHPSMTFQHSGGGHLEKWRRTVGVEFFGHGLSILACVPNFIEIGWKMADLQHYIDLCSRCMLKWGKKLLLGVKTPFWGARSSKSYQTLMYPSKPIEWRVFLLKSEKVDFWSEFHIFRWSNYLRKSRFLGSSSLPMGASMSFTPSICATHRVKSFEPFWRL